MGVAYHLGKGMRDPNFPYLTVMVFGAEPGQIPGSPAFGSAPEILFETAVFDLASLTLNHGVAVALVNLTDMTGNKRVQFDWYRARDNKLLFSSPYLIPPYTGGGNWGWYYCFSYIGWSPSEISEDGAYRVSIQVEGVGSTTIAFSVVGITPVPSPTVGTLQLPAAVRSALDSGWCNLGAGEWGSFLGVNLPPWGLEPGRWALKGLDTVIDAVNWVYTRADEIWDKAYNAAITAGNALSKIDDWLSYAANWWNSLVTSWWSGAQEWVKVWVQDKFNTLWAFIQSAGKDITNIYGKLSNLTDTTKSWQTWLLGSLASISPIDTLIAGYNKMESFYSVYLTQIGDFFRDPPGWIFDRIDDWLNERVS
jgi:hypothetical protein